MQTRASNLSGYETANQQPNARLQKKPTLPPQSSLYFIHLIYVKSLEQWNLFLGFSRHFLSTINPQNLPPSSLSLSYPSHPYPLKTEEEKPTLNVLQNPPKFSLHHPHQVLLLLLQLATELLLFLRKRSPFLTIFFPSTLRKLRFTFESTEIEYQLTGDR